jgi:hypothetical protein
VSGLMRLEIKRNCINSNIKINSKCRKCLFKADLRFLIISEVHAEPSRRALLGMARARIHASIKLALEVHVVRRVEDRYSCVTSFPVSSLYPDS